MCKWKLLYRISECAMRAGSNLVHLCGHVDSDSSVFSKKKHSHELSVKIGGKRQGCKTFQLAESERMTVGCRRVNKSGSRQILAGKQ